MGDTLRPDWSGRLDRTWRAAATPPCAAFIVAAPTNILYLCGFDGSAGLLVLTAANRYLLVDGRYEQAARQALAGGELGPVSIRLAALVTLLSEITAGDVAFEAEQVTVANLLDWQRAVPARTFSPTFGLVERSRLIKEPFELEAIRRACRLTSDVACRLGDWVGEGRTERQVAADIDAALMRAGCSRPAFQTIVASGPNSALPHARPGDRQIRNGDLVVLDFGGVLDGYCGDLTRMAAVGQLQANAQALVNAVRQAQDAALQTVRPGLLASDVDHAAREVLSNLGFGEAFLHATGHGLGLDLHEAPRIGRATEPDRAVRLEAGMVCTIEPGAYVEGLGGARMEDDVVVTVDGCEVLTDAPRDLVIV
jgi:Xaa-Pro aminopeptidase